MNRKQLLLLMTTLVYLPAVFASRDFAPVNNALYKKECSACHMAYQPGLLPSASWKKIMGSLDKHFGDNAELDAKDAENILNYLTKNAADHSSYRRSKRLIHYQRSSVFPTRITETRYIRSIHRELSTRMVTGNPKVKSLSQCNACHTRADTGSYSEREIRIPGYRNWED